LGAADALAGSGSGTLASMTALGMARCSLLGSSGDGGIPIKAHGSVRRRGGLPVS
jgi:hypothetical protein